MSVSKVQLSAMVALAVAMGDSTPIAQAQSLPADTLIKLQRTHCFGACPVYSVTIDATGLVTYDGAEFVRVDGRQTVRIAPADVAALLETAERIGFFNFNDQYRALVTDNPTTFVTITRGGRTKTVEDYVSGPAALKDLQARIDRAAGTRRWVRIDADTLRQMAQQGRVLSGEERIDYFRDALLADDVDVIEVLLQLGVDPDSPEGLGGPPLTMVRSVAAAQVLVDAGANPSTIYRGSSPLLRAARFTPALTEVLLKAGARADQTDESGRTPLFAAACLGNVGVVRLLLQAGANPDARAGGMSILDCIRERSKRPPIWEIDPPVFEQDFPAVVELIERGMEERQRR